eukprot:507189-Rhodomonas_salina.1
MDHAHSILLAGRSGAKISDDDLVQDFLRARRLRINLRWAIPLDDWIHAAKRSTSLVRLDLSHNRIGDEGLGA